MLAKTLKSILLEYAENSSIHGARLIIRKDASTLERIIWLLIVASAIVGSLFLFYILLVRYLSKPTKSQYTPYTLPITHLPFPAVTICHVNTFPESRLHMLLENLHLDKELLEEIRETFSIVMIRNLTIDTKENFNALSQLQGILQYNNYSSVLSVLDQITPNCSEILEKCSWLGKTEQCDKLFSKSLTADGICCSFNYNLHSKYTLYRSIYSGVGSGLKVLTKIPHDSLVFRNTKSLGYKISFHEFNEYPGYGRKVTVEPYTINFLSLRGDILQTSDDIRNLPLYQRDCVFPNEYPLKYFKQFINTNCLSECDSEICWKKCKCVPFFFTFSRRPVCNVSQMACVGKVLAQLGNSENCECPQQCNQIFQDYESSKIDFVEVSKKILNNGFWLDTDINNGSIYLDIFFNRPTVNPLEKVMSTSFVYLLSGFGGVFSLFFGCSLISIVEIVYSLTVRLYIKMALEKRNPETSVQ